MMTIRLSLKHILWCALLVVVVGCGKQAPSSATQHYKTMTVARQDYTQCRQFTARIESQQNIDVFPLVAGILKKLYVQEGARVKKGQPLFVVEQAPFIAAVDAAKARVATARAALSTAQVNLEGKEKLYALQMVGEFDLRRARHARDEAAALLETAEAGLATARTDLDYTTVTSPVDGAISIMNFSEGELVAPTEDIPLAVIAANKHIYAYTSLSEKLLADLLKEYGCSTSAELMSRLPAVALQTVWGEELPQKGHLDAVSGNVDISTGAVLLRASFENPSELFRNGSNGYLLLPTTKHGVFVIPQDAILHIQDKCFVYRVVEGKAAFTEVKGTAADDDEHFVVTSGLGDGDVIVVEHVGLVTEGMAIAPSTEKKGSK